MKKCSHTWNNHSKQVITEINVFKTEVKHKKTTVKTDCTQNQQTFNK